MEKEKREGRRGPVDISGNEYARYVGLPFQRFVETGIH